MDEKMSPEDNAAWNSWCQTIAERVAASMVRALERKVKDCNEALFDLAGEAGREVQNLRGRMKALEGELTVVRERAAEVEAAAYREAAELRERTAALQGELRGRAQGTEVELPALPEAARARSARQN